MVEPRFNLTQHGLLVGLSFYLKCSKESILKGFGIIISQKLNNNDK